MKFKKIASIASIMIFINAIFFLMAPVFSLSLLGRSLTPAGIMITRISGASALGLCLILWQLRDLTDSHLQVSISKSLLTIFILLVVIDLQGIWTHSINNIGWLLFLADMLLGLGFLSSIYMSTVED
jgi:hypothetical protein